MNVIEHGTAGIGDVGDVHLPLSQLPYQPGIHSAEGDLPLLRLLPKAIDMIQEPLELGSGKVRINAQSGLFLDFRLPSLGLQLIAEI